MSSNRIGTTPSQYRRAVDAARNNRPVPDGPVLPSFHPKDLAEAIDKEIVKYASCPVQKVSLHLDPPDAAEFVKFLRSSATDTDCVTGLAFSPRGLATSIEGQLIHAVLPEPRKITIEMDGPNARGLMNFLHLKSGR